MNPFVDESLCSIVKPEKEFKWPEYIVFGAVLVASLAIGVFYGCFGTKNKTNEEFLMAGRSMSILPVTLSLVCSFVSAITLLGNPVEVYFYGQQYTMIAFAFIPMTAALAYLYVPVYFRLQLTSAYEYFEWRFSRRVRVLLSVFALLHLMFYMPTTVLGPSLALDQVANIDFRLSAAAIFIVCIAYSSLGGLKAVLWTDALQAVVMVVSLLSVVIIGTKEVGGLSYVWEISANYNRTSFFNVDPDPRTRHTFWTATIGGFLLWLPLFGATQAQIQRYNSVPSLTKSRQCLLFNMFGMILVICLCSLIGSLIYAQYYQCDPVEAGIVTSADQLLPLFVMTALKEYPGLPGLLVAGLTCGSLSTVSSALNSLTAIITEDFVKFYWPKLSETKLGLISKAISTGSGIIAFGLVFIINLVNKTINISPFSTLMHGALVGPILGSFTLGMFFPWVQETPMLIGLALSILTSGYVGLGTIIAGRQDALPNQKLDLSIGECECSSSNGTTSSYSSFYPNESMYSFPPRDWKADPYSFHLKVSSVSYIWLPGIGGLSTVIYALILTGIYNLITKKRNPVNASLLAKPFVKLWNRVCGEEYMETWIDFRSKPFGKGQAQPKEVDVYQMSIPRASLHTDNVSGYGFHFKNNG